MQNRGIRMSPVSKFAHGIDCITQHVVFLMGYIYPFEHLFGSTKIGLSAPHLCVSSCFWLCTPVRIRSSSSSRLLLLLPPPPPPASSITHNSRKHNLLTHISLTHNLLSHTHTQLSHKQLSHKQLSHTTCLHRTLSHTTYSHTTCSHTTLSHTTCSHTTLSNTHTTCSHTTLTHNSLTNNPLLSPRLFVWQAWHLATSTFILCGRCGNWKHPPPFCVAGVALRDIDLHFVAGVRLLALGWLWWRAWFLLGLSPRLLGVAIGSRRGTWRHQPSFCVADVALESTHLHSVWQALHLEASTCNLWQAALESIHFHSVWQAWHLATSTFTLCGRRALMALGWLWWRALDSRLCRGPLRGKRGNQKHWSPVRVAGVPYPPSSCVAGVVLGVIDLQFVWQVRSVCMILYTLPGFGPAQM